jgi:DNA-binding winged helix-turn-helix (wHTH) protein/Flp pilus assembly protein TadD/TolB-like protein
MIMNSAEKQIYRFADVEINTSQNCLKRGDREYHLRQKAFAVLLYLLEQRQRVVTKDELMNIVWKDTAVTDDALVQCIKEIRRSIGDDSHRQRFIKTIPKSGYRFIGTLEESKNGFYADAADLPVEKSIEKSAKKSDYDAAFSIPELIAGRKVFFAIFLAVFVISLFSFLGQTVRQKGRSYAEVTLPQIAGKKTLAVMFFENQSKSTKLEWLREGLPDMLITNLSRSTKLTVLSRQQFQLLLERAGHQSGERIGLETALEIARKSQAEWFIIGSYAQLGEKLRLDVQLYDAQTGGLQTAESLIVEKTEQILTEIDLLSIKLAARLDAGEPESRTTLGTVMTDNLEAYRYYSLSLEKARGLHKKDAIELLEKAVALDPEFAMAHARIGHTYAVTWGWAEKAKPHLERAFALSDRLTEKDRLYITAWYAIANLDYPAAIGSFREIIAKYPTETEAYLRLGYLLRGEEEFEEAISVMRQGLTIDPDSSALYNALGLLYSLLGRHTEAIAMHERYVALEPAEANARDSLGMSYQWAGRYEEAIAEYNRALELNPNFEIAYAHLGVALFQTGRYRMAIDWFKKYIAVAPSELESERGYAYIAHVYRKQKNPAAAQAVKQTIKENKFYIW